MNFPRIQLRAVLALGLSVALPACAQEPQATPASTAGSTAAEARADGSEARPLLVVHKTPWCGCCTAWAEQAEAAGFAVELRDHEDLDPIKEALGVPAHQASCHTAEIEGYFVEGHVPFDDIRRLLAERPRARGIAVPGMPLGSPGMEAHVLQSFSTHLIDADGGISEYAHHRGDQPQR